MLSICAWKWRSGGPSDRFSAVHVNTLQAAMAKHLHLPHEVVCVTDDPRGLDRSIRIVPLPLEFSDTPRCRRRMRIFDRDFAAQIGSRILSIDLDMVIVGDLTPIVDRPEPLVAVRIDYADVLSGSFLLMDAGVLHPLWDEFRRDPEGLPRRAWPRGIGSDQAMLNYYLQTQPPIPTWGRADGFVTFFGAGYEPFEHLGVGPHRPSLPPDARVVILGSDDLPALEDPRYRWAAEHWVALRDATQAEVSA